MRSASGAQRRYQVHVSWLFSPWRFAAVAPAVGAMLFFISRPFPLLAAPVVLLSAVMFGAVPAFAAGAMFGLLAIVFERLAAPRLLGAWSGGCIGAVSGVVAAVLLAVFLGGSAFSKDPDTARIQLIALLSCAIAGARFAYRERQARRAIRHADDPSGNHEPAPDLGPRK